MVETWLESCSTWVPLCSAEYSSYIPHITYLFFRYAFSLEENNQRDLAESICRQSIAIQPKNPWAFHAMCKSHN